MTTTAENTQHHVTVTRPESGPVLLINSAGELAIKAGTIVTIGEVISFDEETNIPVIPMSAGHDYGIGIDADGQMYVSELNSNPLDGDYFAGFHFAPGGNAKARSGGDTTPGVNSHSIWDVGFRPSCKDPRGMTRVEMAGSESFWVDIYLLNADHNVAGTSRAKALIADGHDQPMKLDGTDKYRKLDYATAVEVYAGHGKRLLGAEEFFAAAYGTTERASRSLEPKKTGVLDDGAARFISKWGMFDATGTMWQWGTDGDPDNPRASIFGGSWIHGGDAGSRYAYLDNWPGNSSELIGARGASDHLNLA